MDFEGSGDGNTYQEEYKVEEIHRSGSQRSTTRTRSCHVCLVLFKGWGLAAAVKLKSKECTKRDLPGTGKERTEGGKRIGSARVFGRLRGP